MKKTPLSHFARFFLEFQGYDFYDHDAKRKLEKYELWIKYRYLCHVMTEKKKAVTKFTLISRDGWKNGLRIKREE